MLEYGIGGQEVRGDASEAISEIPQNKTLMVEKLTANEVLKPELVYGLKTVEEVFEHFKPETLVEFEGNGGTKTSESFQFRNLGDFSSKNLIDRSQFLHDLKIQQDEYLKIIRQLKTNTHLKSVLGNPETKDAFVNTLKALAQELEENNK